MVFGSALTSHSSVRPSAGMQPLRSQSEKLGEFSAVIQHSDLHKKTSAKEVIPNKDLPKAARAIVKQVINGTLPFTPRDAVPAGKGQVTAMHHPELASSVIKMEDAPAAAMRSGNKEKKKFTERTSKVPELLAWQCDSKPSLDISLV